jgi:hypothetical protein
VEWLDVEGVATILGVSRTTVYKWCKKGELRCVRRKGIFTRNPHLPHGTGGNSGSRIFIPRVEVEEFLIRKWQTKFRTKKRPTVERLLVLGQENGEIQVSVAPEVKPGIRKQMLSQAARLYMQQKGTYRDLTEEVGDRDQLELFDDHAPTYYTFDPFYSKEETAT